MNRSQYLKELDSYLKSLGNEDRKDAIEYCSQYFDEAGMSNEEKAIKELGSPKQFANNLIANITIKNDNRYEEEINSSIKTAKKNTKGDIKTIWIVLLAIAALPLGLPILIAIAATLFGLLIAAVCIIFALGIAVFAIPFGLLSGIPITLPFISDMFYFGNDNNFLVAGIILLSVSMLALLLLVLYKVVKFAIMLIKKIVIAIYNKINKNNITLPDFHISSNSNLINKSYRINENIKEIYIEANSVEFEVVTSPSIANIDIEIKRFSKEEHIYFNVDENKLFIRALNGVSNLLFSRPKVIVSIADNKEFDIFSVKSKGSSTSIKNIISKNMIIENNAGEIKSKSNALESIDIKNIAGSINLELETDSKNIIVENDKGDIKIKTKEISKYSYSLSNHAGSINIAGKLYDSLNNDVINENTDINIKVKNNKGAVSVQ